MATPALANWMRDFLASEAEAQTRMLVGLRDRLERGMAAADAKSAEPPSREWVRAARVYFDGYHRLATLELETAKLHLLAEKRPMTEEQIAAGMAELGREAVRTLSDEEFAAEVERRRGSRALAEAIPVDERQDAVPG